MTQEPLKIGDKVEFSFFGKIKTGTISEIKDGIYTADFDEQLGLKQFDNLGIIYYVEPTKFIKVSGTIEWFKKK